MGTAYLLLLKKETWNKSSCCCCVSLSVNTMSDTVNAWSRREEEAEEEEEGMGAGSVVYSLE